MLEQDKMNDCVRVKEVFVSCEDDAGLTQDLTGSPDDPLGDSHMIKHEDIKFSCEICDNQFSRKGNLDNHHKSVHGGKMFRVISAVTQEPKK